MKRRRQTVRDLIELFHIADRNGWELEAATYKRAIRRIYKARHVKAWTEE